MRRVATLLTLVLAAQAHAAFKPLVHLDLRGGMASTGDKAPTWVVLGNLYAVPGLTLSKKVSLVPSLYANSSGQGRSIEEDTLFVQNTVMGFRPSLKFGEPDSLFTLRGDMRRNMAVAAFNDPLGKGYYDYEEYGAGLAWDGKAAGLAMGLGLDYSRRGYPFARRQGSELLGGRNERTKDYSAYKGSLRSALGLVGDLSYTLQWKDYEDSYVLGADPATGNITGIVSQQRQQDLLSSLGLAGGLALNRAWSLDWGGRWTWNASNQNSFDTARNVGIPKGQDYYALSLDLGTGWHGRQWKADLGYSLTFRGMNRPVQSADGTYKDLGNKVNDLENGLSLGLGRKLVPGLSWVAQAGGRIVSSSQLYAGAGSPNYGFYNVTTGMVWDWE